MDTPQTIENEAIAAAGFAVQLQTSIAMNNAGAGDETPDNEGNAGRSRLLSNRLLLLMN